MEEAGVASISTFYSRTNKYSRRLIPFIYVIHPSQNNPRSTSAGVLLLLSDSFDQSRSESFHLTQDAIGEPFSLPMSGIDKFGYPRKLQWEVSCATTNSHAERSSAQRRCTCACLLDPRSKLCGVRRKSYVDSQWRCWCD